jgi:hypothetical protein
MQITVTEDIVTRGEDDGSVSGFVDHCCDDEEESDFSVYSENRGGHDVDCGHPTRL